MSIARGERKPSPGEPDTWFSSAESLEHAEVTKHPLLSELTVPDAADFLNVSPPFLVTLLETKQIASHGVDGDLRVRLADLEMFKHQRTESSAKALDLGY